MKTPLLLGTSMIAVLGLMPMSGGLFAEEKHGGEGKTEMAEAKTFAAAMQEIDEHYTAITKLLDTNKLESVHVEAEHIQHHALALAKLALAPDSGVPKENIKNINLTGKELAGTFEKIDEAADAGKKPETKAIYDEMGTLIAKLKTLSKPVTK